MANHYHLRRVREFAGDDSVPVSKRDWHRMVARYQGCCAYCGVRTERLTRDHVIPLARGGRHAIGNLVPACLSCNSSKGDDLLVEFKARIRRRSDRRLAAA